MISPAPSVVLDLISSDLGEGQSVLIFVFPLFLLLFTSLVILLSMYGVHGRHDGIVWGNETGCLLCTEYC